MSRVRVWFYNPCMDESGWLNKLVSRLDPPYCHCEVQFVDDVSCSIYMGTKAGLRTRCFDESSYDCVVVPCSAKQHAAMYAAATSIVAQQVQFSALKMTGCMMWVPVVDDARFTFCSKLCADILQSAQVLEPHTDTGKVTPSSLCRLLQRRPLPLCVVPEGPSLALDFK